MDLFELSENRRQAALRAIRQSGVVEAWESVGATVNLVGSVRSGLIMKHLDIDLHIYTDDPPPAAEVEAGLSAHTPKRAKRNQPTPEAGVGAGERQTMLEKSRAAIERLQQNPAIDDVRFCDLLDTEEACLEWHARYTDTDGVGWQLDMIHIRRGSAFDGAIERTTDAIVARITPELREAILRIKHDAPDGVKTPGIEVYYAVLELGLRTYEQFAAWKKAVPSIDLLGWRA